MRTMVVTIAMVLGLIPSAGAAFSDVGVTDATKTERQTQATRVVVLKVEGMT